MGRTIFILFVVVVILIMIVGIPGIKNEQSIEQLCLENGYSEVRWVSRVAYCVGRRDGTTVTVRAERLR